MTGSTISVIIITVAFALLAFVIALILSYTFGSSKIAADKRMEELKKQEGYTEVALIKNKKKTRRKKESENSFFVKFASALYSQLQSADIKMRPEEFLLIWVIVSVLPALFILLISDIKSQKCDHKALSQVAEHHSEKENVCHREYRRRVDLVIFRIAVHLDEHLKRLENGVVAKLCGR